MGFLQMKYIFIDDDLPVLFPMQLKHSYVAKELGELKPSSAGFVKLENGKIECFGQSESLGIGSKEEDSKIVQMHLGVL